MYATHDSAQVFGEPCLNQECSTVSHLNMEHSMEHRRVVTGERDSGQWSVRAHMRQRLGAAFKLRRCLVNSREMTEIHTSLGHYAFY